MASPGLVITSQLLPHSEGHMIAQQQQQPQNGTGSGNYASCVWTRARAGRAHQDITASHQVVSIGSSRRRGPGTPAEGLNAGFLGGLGPGKALG